MQGELKRLIAKEAGTAFDLERGPLIRGRLIQLTEDEHVLLITMHHIVSDGWSMGILLNELSALYGAFLRGEADPLPELEVQYADYAVWQRKWMEGEILREQAEYWKTALAGAPEVTGIAGRPCRPAQQDYAGASVGLVLDEELTAGLKELSRRHGTTLYMTLAGGLGGAAGAVVGAGGCGDWHAGGESRAEGDRRADRVFREHAGVAMDLSGSPTVGELLERVKGQALAAQQHQDIPFEQVVEMVRPVAEPGAQSGVPGDVRLAERSARAAGTAWDWR